MYYQVMFGYFNTQIIECENDEEAKKVAFCLYRGWSACKSKPGFCIIKRGYGYDISRNNYDILVCDCL